MTAALTSIAADDQPISLIQMQLQTYQTVPIPAPIWLQNALKPAIQACRFESAPPVELRPTGRWRGWCASLTEAPDGRLVVSSRAQFWRKNEVAQVFLHEASHRLITSGLHNASFLCMNLCLLMRADLADLGQGVLFANSASLYDIQDLPPQLADELDQGLSRSIKWAVLTARQLVQDHPQMSAEGLAAEVEKAFDEWIAELYQEPKKRALQVQRVAQQVAQQKELLASLTERIFTLRLVVGGLGFLLAATFFLGLK